MDLAGGSLLWVANKGANNHFPIVSNCLLSCKICSERRLSLPAIRIPLPVEDFRLGCDAAVRRGLRLAPNVGEDLAPAPEHLAPFKSRVSLSQIHLPFLHEDQRCFVI